MTSEWFVRINNVERGPISSETLKHLAMDGKVMPKTPIRKGASGDWVPAGRVKGLFDRVSHELPQQPGSQNQPPPLRVPVATPLPNIPQPAPQHSTAILSVKRSPSHIGPTVPAVESKDEGFSSATLIVMWSTVAVFALGSVVFLAWFSCSQQQAKILAANDRISEAVATANKWIVSNSPVDGETAEQRLASALADKDATEKARGDAMLRQVRDQRKQITERLLIERAQQQADAVLEDAKQQIDRKRVTEALVLLRKYTVDPHATKRAEAERLLSEAEAALSDTLAFDVLMAMDNQRFDRTKATCTIDDGKITYPALLAIRNETVRRNLEKAAHKREEIRVAEEKHREDIKVAEEKHREEIRAAALEQHRKETRAIEEQRRKEKSQADEEERERRSREAGPVEVGVVSGQKVFGRMLGYDTRIAASMLYDYVVVRNMFKELHKTEERYLVAVVTVKNFSATKKIDFTGWGSNMFRAMAWVADDLGNNYKMISFGTGKVAAGQDEVAIYPQQHVTDILVFEMPVNAARKFTLNLRGENVGWHKDIEIPFTLDDIAYR
jgi:hypothetical protein